MFIFNTGVMKAMFKDVHVLILLLILGCTSTSCYRKFYQAKTHPANIRLDSLMSVSPPKYFILRNDHDAYKMAKMELDTTDQSLSCTLDKVDKEHYLYLNATPGKPMRYRNSKGEAAVLNEVHIYIQKDSNLANGEQYILQTGNITKIDVLEKNKSRTKQSTVTSTAGIAAGVTALTIGAVLIGSLMVVAIISAL